MTGRMVEVKNKQAGERQDRRADLTVEFLLVSTADFERVVLPYKRNLERLGVKP